jgi:type II secretory pathway pseudopilin PulG
MLLRNTRDGLPWLQLGLEAGLVVLSVLLALGLESWRRSAVEQDRARRAIENVEQEIRNNQAAIQDVISVHRSLLDTLDSDTPPMGISASSASIQNNAWDAAQSMDAVAQLDADLVAALSKVQEIQQQYQQVSNISFEVLLQGTFGCEGRSAPEARGSRQSVFRRA